jgi:hypothetical protein
MAIYPYYSTTTINKDVLTASSFKAGMALILDTNGRAVKADSQQLVFNNTYQKYGRFLGFAASDHDLSSNTIIVPDNVGNNHLDINNRFIKNENTEYAVPKRGLMDLQDTAVSNFYNPSDISVISKRGIGVYNTPGDYFVTDQFNPVLHGDYGFDGLDIQTINPGDLLTLGGGANTGKLVKVNVNSIGPDVLIVAIVEKYIVQTGLLHFRQANYGLSFGSTGLQLYYDTANLASYIPNNTTVTDLVTGTRNATLFNGPAYSPLASGSINFDGSDDYLGSSVTVSTVSVTNQITMNVWFMRKVDYIGVGFLMPIAFNQMEFGFDYFPGQIRLWHIAPGNVITSQQSGITIDLNAWVNITLTYNGSTYILYKNGVNVYSFSLTGNFRTTQTFSFTNTWDSVKAAMLSQAQIYNRVLTPTEILNQFNFNKSRYGL